MIHKLTAEQIKFIEGSINTFEQIVFHGKHVQKITEPGSYALNTYFRICLFERFTSRLQSGSILLKEYENNPTIEDSIGLILRGSLLDFITLIYLDSYMHDVFDEETEIESNDKLLSFFSDHIVRTVAYVNQVHRNGIRSTEERNLMIKNLYSKNSALFATDVPNLGDPLKDLKVNEHFPSPTQMLERLYKHPIAVNYKGIGDLYEFYGKYEHFGIYTNALQTESTEYTLETMMFSFRYLIEGIFLSGTHLKNNFNIDDPLFKIIDLGTDYLKSLSFFNETVISERWD
jgi:hypothetical protein